MNISFLTLSFLGFFALLHFLAVPVARRQLRGDRSPSSIAKASTLAVLEFARTFSLIGFLTLGVMSVAIVSLSLFGGTTISGVERNLSRMQEWRDAVGSFGSGWNVAVVIFLVVALGLLSRRAAKRRRTREFQELLQRELERIQAAQENGTLEEIPPTQEMERVLSARRDAVQHVAVLSAAPVTDFERRQKLEQVKAYLEKLDEALSTMKLQQHVKPELNEPELEVDRSSGPWKRARTFLVSEGLVTNLGRGSRALLYAGLVLLFLSLVGMGTDGVGRALDVRIVEFEELSVHLTKEEARESFEQVVQAGRESDTPDGEELDEEDEAVLDLLAEEFEVAFAESDLWQDPDAGPDPGPDDRGRGPPASSLRSLIVRQQILDRSSSVRSGAAEVQRSFAQVEGLSTIERDALRVYERASRVEGPRTSLGVRARADLRAVAQESPSTWQKLMVKARVRYQGELASFRRPAQISDVTRLLLSESVGAAIDGAPALQGEAGQLAKRIVSEVGTTAAERMYDVKLQRFVTDLAEGRTMDQAVQGVRSSGERAGRIATSAERAVLIQVSRELPAESNLASKLESHPPALRSKWTGDVNLPEARASVQRMLARSSSTMARPVSYVTDSLASYDDWFPGQQGSERTTERGKVLEQHRARTSPPFSRTAPVRTRVARTGGTGARTEVSSTAFRRARSFRMLRGFARVGGVLIGRPPEEVDSTVDFRDFEWQRLDDGRLEFALVRADGEIFTLGPYRASLVHLALVYAADGRPTAVTMTTATPLAELKILLHPALVDTAMGCRIIELDRFVDVATGENDERISATSSVAGSVALYRLAWIQRLSSLVESAPANPSLLMELRNEPGFEEALTYADGLANDASLSMMAILGLNEPEALRDAGKTPLRMPFFDRRLVEIVLQCADGADGALDAFVECVKARSARSADVSSALTLPPEYEDWSGVRELPYEVDPDLEFLEAPANRTPESTLWPFEFILQLAFHEEVADGEDSLWDYPALKPHITRAVAGDLRAGTLDASVFHDSRELTVLQRFFRTALSGQLGDRFPLASLVDLTEETAPALGEPWRTPRWNARPGQLEDGLARVLSALQVELEGRSEIWALTANRQIDSCLGLIQDEDSRPEKIPDGRWASGCTFDDARELADRICSIARAAESVDTTSCYIGFIADQATSTTEARRLRAALGVSRDDELLVARMQAGGRQCSAVP